MAEFCKECFISFLCPPEVDSERIVVSDELCLCEGCGEFKQVVIEVES